jgi:hypothetical protein
MKIRKSLASVAAGSLAIAGLAVATAPAADAFSGAGVLHCALYFGDAGTGSSPSNLSATYTLTQSPANPAPGQNVVVTLAGSTGGTNGPVEVEANTLRLQATLEFSGVMTGTMTTQSSAVGVGSYPSANVPGSDLTAVPPVISPLPAWTTTGSYTASGNGAATLAVKQLKFDAVSTSPTLNVDTYCSGADNNPGNTTGSGQPSYNHKAAPVTSTTIVETFDVDARTLSSTATVGRVEGSYDPDGPFGPSPVITQRGSLVPLTLNDAWVAGTGTLSFCPDGQAVSDNTGCVTAGTVTIPTIASGGTATVSPRIGAVAISTSPELRQLRFSDGSKTKTIDGFSLLAVDSGAITISQPNGGPGTLVGVEGSGYGPFENVTVSGFKTVSGNPFTVTADTTNVVTDGDGLFSTSITVNDAATQKIGGTAVLQDTSFAPVFLLDYLSFTVNKDRCTKVQAGSIDPVTGQPVDGIENAVCNTEQNVNAKVVPGALQQQAFTTGINPNATTVWLDADPATAGQQALEVPLADTDITGVLNSVRVTDQRGGVTGWSLTSAFAGDFTNAGGDTISSERFSVSGLSCAGITNSAPSTPGSGGAYADDSATAAIDESVQTLCYTTDNATNALTSSTSGQWSVEGDVTLDVPAFQAAGSYTAQLVITLT